MDIKKILGKNVKHYRKIRKMTQEKLAEAINISTIHLSHIENGQRFASAKNLEGLCKVLEIAPSSLFFTVDQIDGDESTIASIIKLIHDEKEVFFENLVSKLTEEIESKEKK